MPQDSIAKSIACRRGFRVNLSSWLALLLSVMVGPFGVLSAQEKGPPESAPIKAASNENAGATASPTDAGETLEAKPGISPKQRRSLIIASIMLAGIVAVVLFLFLWMLWLSRRTHQMLRQPLPEAGRGDELWYLKAKQDVEKATERIAARKQTPPPQSRPPQSRPPQSRPNE